MTEVPDTITRVVIINGGEKGDKLQQEEFASSWQIEVQDDGRTLKLIRPDRGRKEREARGHELAKDMKASKMPPGQWASEQVYKRVRYLDWMEAARFSPYTHDLWALGIVFKDYVQGGVHLVDCIQQPTGIVGRGLGSRAAWTDLCLKMARHKWPEEDEQ